MAKIVKDEHGPHIAMWVSFRVTGDDIEKVIQSIVVSEDLMDFQIKKLTKAKVEKELRDMVAFYGEQFPLMGSPVQDPATRQRCKNHSALLYPELY